MACGSGRPSLDASATNEAYICTIRGPIAPKTIVKELSEAGIVAQSGGFVDMPFLAHRLRDRGVSIMDCYLLTLGVWLKTLFGTYFVATRA